MWFRDEALNSNFTLKLGSCCSMPELWVAWPAGCSLCTISFTAPAGTWLWNSEQCDQSRLPSGYCCSWKGLTGLDCYIGCLLDWPYNTVYIPFHVYVMTLSNSDCAFIHQCNGREIEMWWARVDVKCGRRECEVWCARENVNDRIWHKMR